MTEPIARIEAALTRLGAEHEPPAGWEARVLAATAASTNQAEPKRKEPICKWWWLAVPAVASAATAIAFVLSSRNDPHLQLVLTVDKNGPVVLGTSAQVGDVVHATATGGAHRAVWIYREDALVMACPGAAQCRVTDTSTIADVTLSSIGEYVIVALSSRAPISTPTGVFDTDIAHVHDAGVMKQIEPLIVR